MAWNLLVEGMKEVGGDETGHAGWIGVGFECHTKEFAP